MLPAVPVNCDVGVIFSRGVSRSVDGSSMVLLLVNLDSQVYHFVVKINLDTSGCLHDLLVFRENHVLSEVIFSVELCQIVTTDLVSMKVGACDTYNISVLPFVIRMI
jgi:hypothetical protein